MDDRLKQKLKNYVLWLLGRQEYSRRELTQKLQQREATDEFIENLLDWCEKHNRPDSQCFVCHPENFEKFAARYEAKFGEQPPKPTE